MHILRMMAIMSLWSIGFIICTFTDIQAGRKGLTEESLFCLQCHEKKGVDFLLMNKETLSVYVDSNGYKTSVHSFMKCSECHRGFSVDKHPQRRFRSITQYKLKSARICRRCHTDGQICAKEIHSGLLEREKEGISPVCADCHSAHAVMPIAGGKLYFSEKKYCSSCHAYDIQSIYRNGEIASLKVDMPTLDRSVHKTLSCTDCHFGFSSEEHPQRNFKTRREYRIASSETCRRCHFNKYSETLESIHYAMLRKGNLAAPVCTDCHGAHSIEHIHTNRIVIARKCQQCHQDVYALYAQSVHGDAMINQYNRDVPVCIDCHRAHDIRNPMTLEWHELIPEMCSNCHANKEIMDKYGLTTDVVKSYLSDFHGVTLGFYKKQREVLDKPARPIAVCSDCHGTHNITSMRSSNVIDIKQNLLKRCQACHDDISSNFPDIWLSHYEPTLATAPLVFIVKMFYKIFIPFLVIGLILQILLHIWRYSFNR